MQRLAAPVTPPLQVRCPEMSRGDWHMFAPGMSWLGLGLNRWGSVVPILRTNASAVRPCSIENRRLEAAGKVAVSDDVGPVFPPTDLTRAMALVTNPRAPPVAKRGPASIRELPVGAEAGAKFCWPA